ncbi:GrpB family protein [Microlunatus speluncae]|uniref:GrpB family protein n=1 Tax=Microlunatus speluncae TaxID=2594267 RepID=UPI0012660BE4|nr:GrpB family protein [Microlunatus speluncae]
MTAERNLVEVVDWTPEWPQRFARARGELVAVLPDDVTIEHFGSTSVPRLAAKPIIDILAVTDRPAGETDGALASLGFFAIPRYFTDDPDHRCFGRNRDGRRAENLHLFHPRSPHPQWNRDFRDYLIARPDAADRYGRVKRAAAIVHPGSRADYSDEKLAIMRSLAREARDWAAARTRI